MNILIIGGSGFIGYNIYKNLDLIKLFCKKNDIEKCKLCKGNSGWILTEQGRSRLVDRYSPTMEEHLKTYHPNNEVLDDIDFMVVFNDQKEQLRIYRDNRGVNYE